MKKINEKPLVFSYFCLDELYTFIGKKSNKAYIWVAVGVRETVEEVYFYMLSKKKDKESLKRFSSCLPEAKKYYADGKFTYESVFGEKVKSKYTNIIENLNSQKRDKISYLVRETKGHAKFFEWLDNKLALI